MIFNKQARRNAIKMEGERSSSLNLARGRLVLMSGVFILAYIFLAIRAVDLTVIHSPVKTGEQIAQALSETPMRADILDRNGVMLATTLRASSLYVDPYLIADPQKTATGLTKIFPDLTYGDTLQKLQSSKRFVWLKRGITPDEQAKTLELGEPGLAFQHDQKRIYPHGNLVSHLVGFSNIDSQGLAGVERSFNKFLGTGEPLKLTIDIRLQHALRREVTAAIEQFDAVGAAAIIMDVQSGDMLAGVSLPDFDPHAIAAANQSQIFNRMTLGAYELGSVFKIFSTAAFLETHDVPMGTTFDASEPIKMGRFTINDYHAEDRILTIPEVFMYSSNIGSAMMGEAVGTEKLRNFYQDLGLLTPLDFEIHEVAKPMVPNPWRDINTLTASYGHGVATTPLQLAAGVSSIVNGGYFIKPKLVMNEAAAQKSPQNSEDIRIVSPQTAHRMRQLLRLVVTDGTGSNAAVPGYRVGGKTGTAEKIKATGGYDKGKLISSFVGVFPMEAPRYLVFIAVDEPKGNKESFGYATGGWVAAPAVARTIASMASILGIPAEPVTAEQDLGTSLKQYVADKKS